MATTRFDGVVKSWNDERAFGFIEPAQGGQEIFVHITAFPRGDQPPQRNQRVSFEIELNRDGRKRVRNARLVRPAQAPRSRPPRAGAQWGGASLFVVPAFLVLYLVVALIWRVPNMVALVYLGLSAVCYVAYAADKLAAKYGGWRTKESTLLLIGLAGGWPGALLAQQFLRHKSVKASFRTAFWITVILNVMAFVALSSPQGGAWHVLK